MPTVLTMDGHTGDLGVSVGTYLSPSSIRISFGIIGRPKIPDLGVVREG